MVTVAWGLNSTKGMLGVGDGTTPHRTPTTVAGGVALVQAMAGQNAGFQFGIGLDATGIVYTWGDNSQGQLGIGTTDASNHQTPGAVPSLSGVVSVLADGFANGWALLPSGDLYAWGRNLGAASPIGAGATGNISTPILVNTGVAKVRAGAGHSIVLKTNGHVETVGFNNDGQLGTGNTTNHDTWVDVTPASGTVVDVAADVQTTYLVMDDGTTQGCGDSSVGQLGTSGSLHTSFIAGPMTGAIEVHASGGAVFYPRADGTSWALGANNSGQLGIGSTSPGTTTTPLQMAWPIGVSPIQWGIASSNLFNGDGAVALGSDHLVYNWGDGTSGQNGNGLTTPASNPTPQSVNGLTGMNWVGGMGASVFAGDVVLHTAHGRHFAQILG